jgi:hypothetical protein
MHMQGLATLKQEFDSRHRDNLTLLPITCFFPDDCDFFDSCANNWSNV